MQTLLPDARPKLSARARLQTDKVTGKPILLYPEGVLVLNSTGHAIVSLCDGKLTLQEMTAKLTGNFKAGNPEQISADVAQYLNALRARNLLDLLSEPPN
ncbi:MAG: pyrroloquinoline quinone biosynthesis protein [Verrucomicrobiota bacterium]|jgi:pyrroloquinoline quinone biosynthesis protein D